MYFLIATIVIAFALLGWYVSNRPSNIVFLWIDVQKDFCPGGTLAVPNGDQVVPVINKVTRLIETLTTKMVRLRRRIITVFSRDKHKPNTPHFKKWPVHCVEDTPGAEFHKDLVVPSDAYTHTVYKGMTEKIDDLSAFDEDARINGVTLPEFLKQQKVRKVFIGGLAGDYCVLESVKDAVSYGFEVYVIVDAIRSVEPKSGRAAIETMRRIGATLIRSEDIEKYL